MTDNTPNYAPYFAREEDRLILYFKKTSANSRRKNVVFTTAIKDDGTSSSEINFYMGKDGKLRITTGEFTKKKEIRKFNYMTVSDNCTEIELESIASWDFSD